MKVFSILSCIPAIVYGCSVSGAIDAVGLSASLSFLSGSPHTLSIVQTYTFFTTGSACPASLTGLQTVVAGGISYVAAAATISNVGVPVTVTYGFSDLTLSNMATLGPTYITRIGTFYAAGGLRPTGTGTGLYFIPAQASAVITAPPPFVPIQAHTTSSPSTSGTAIPSTTTPDLILQSTPSQPEQKGSSNGLTGAAIGGIVGGMIGGFALLGVLVIFLLRRRKQNYEVPTDSPPPSYPEKQVVDGEKTQEDKPGYPFYEGPTNPASRYPENDGEDILDGPVGGRTAMEH